jgi:hypothetical protein
MKRIPAVCLAMVLAFGFMAGFAEAQVIVVPPNPIKTVLSFNTMVGVNGPFLGAANPIRGVNGGGLPWVFNSVSGRLLENGRLQVTVNGLIIPASAGVGFNPAPFFRLIVSCLTLNPSGVVVTKNIITRENPAVMVGDPRNGNAVFNSSIRLPNPCIAPIIFITSPTGSWFAVTGSGVIP